MAIQLVNAEEVVSRRGGKTKGEKYSKYAQAVGRITPWIKDQIKGTPDGKIRVKSSDIGKEMGSDFEKKSPGALYWGLKFVLFHEGIVVDTATHKTGEKLLVMRTATDDDKLPTSLSKYYEPEEEDMPSPEGGDENQ